MFSFLMCTMYWVLVFFKTISWFIVFFDPGMKKKNRKSNVYFILLNCCLLLLGVLLLISIIYVINNTTLNAIIKELPIVCEIGIIVSFVLIILAVFGFGASCGGCALYFYVFIMTLLNLLLFVGFVAAFLIFFAFLTPKPENGIVQFINTTITKRIEDPYNTAYWKKLQDSLDCCGYHYLQQTGVSCLRTAYTDCSRVVFELISKGSLLGGIGLAIIVLVFLVVNCVAFHILKAESSCKKIE